MCKTRKTTGKKTGDEFESENENVNLDYGSAKKRIAKWTLKLQQNNHKILKAFISESFCP